jgi:hypothetical protein
MTMQSGENTSKRYPSGDEVFEEYGLRIDDFPPSPAEVAEELLKPLKEKLENLEIKKKCLFQLGEFTLHSGEKTFFKLDCDHLSDDDLECVAYMAWCLLPSFGAVEGVPRGGLRLAEKLKKWIRGGPLLVVDDVTTTGASLENHRAGRDAIGFVIFSRGFCPSWVTPLFTMRTK